MVQLPQRRRPLEDDVADVAFGSGLSTLRRSTIGTESQSASYGTPSPGLLESSFGVLNRSVSGAPCQHARLCLQDCRPLVISMLSTMTEATSRHAACFVAAWTILAFSSGCVVLHSRSSSIVPLSAELAANDSIEPTFSARDSHTIHCDELLDHSIIFSYRNVEGDTVSLRSVDSLALGSAHLHRLSRKVEGPRHKDFSSMVHPEQRNRFVLCSPDGFAEINARLLSEYERRPMANSKGRYLVGSFSTDARHLRLRPGFIIPTTLHERVYQVEVLGGGYRVSSADSVALGPLFALGGWEVDPQGRIRFRRRIPSAALCPTPYGLRRCSVAWVFQGSSHTPQPTRQ